MWHLAFREYDAGALARRRGEWPRRPRTPMCRRPSSIYAPPHGDCVVSSRSICHDSSPTSTWPAPRRSSGQRTNLASQPGHGSHRKLCPLPPTGRWWSGGRRMRSPDGILLGFAVSGLAALHRTFNNLLLPTVTTTWWGSSCTWEWRMIEKRETMPPTSASNYTRLRMGKNANGLVSSDINTSTYFLVLKLGASYECQRNVCQLLKTVWKS